MKIHELKGQLRVGDTLAWHGWDDEASRPYWTYKVTRITHDEVEVADKDFHHKFHVPWDHNGNGWRLAEVDFFESIGL